MSAVVLEDVSQLEQALGLPYRLGEEQRAVVGAPLDSALVVAGAGSGKTETMSLRVAWLVGTGQVRADEVLGLTFTRKAAGELAERVTRAVERMQAWSGDGRGTSVLVERPQARTYHSFAADLVAAHAARLHLDEVRLLGEAAGHQLVDRVVRDWPHPLDIGMEPRAVAAAVLSMSGQCAEHRVTTEQLAAVLDEHVGLLQRQLDAGYLTTAKEREVLAGLRRRQALVPLLAAYTRRKREAGLLDHGDQVLLAAEVAGAPEVAEQLRAEHRVVFLDEYQDTSSVQTDLLSSLFGDGHPVTAVGDPHQSIFGWRGASSGTLGRFLRHFRSRDGGEPARFALSTSWRNPRLVLDVANRVAADLREPTGPAAGRALEVGVLRPAPDAAGGQVRAAYLATVEDEAELVAGWLRDRRGTTAGAGRVPTQAVLCRRRSQMARFEDALKEAGVPVVVLGLGGLLDEPEVVDLVSVLTAAADPGRGDALVRLLTGPRWTLSPADLDALSDRARELAGADRDAASLVDALDLLPGPGWVSPRGRRLSGAGRARCAALAGVLARVRQSLHRPVVDVVLAAVQATGVDVEVLAASPDPRQGRRVLDRFVSEAAGYVDVDGTATLPGFLAWLDAARDDERGLEVVDVAPDPAAVQIITIHSAKGLEWDDVAVVDLVQGGFPVREATGAPTSGWLSGNGELPWPARGDRDSLPVWRPHAAVSAKDFKRLHEEFRAGAGAHAAAEERRLAYVALTRPRRSLLVTGARWATGSRPRDPSPFLLEACEAGAVDVGWYQPPEGDAPEVNPREEPENERPWPAGEPEASRRLREAADAVRGSRDDALAGTRTDTQVLADAADEAGARAGAQVVDAAAEVARWERVVDALLAERAVEPTLAVPGHLSASQVVALADDARSALLDLARPVPRRPYRQARRGSRFHEWVETRSGPRHGLFEPEELLGAVDDSDADDAELAELKARFEASEWSSAHVVGVEVPFATPLRLGDGRVVLRGRIDAVVRSSRPGLDLEVVDWKTGRPPTEGVAGARSAQLAVYRLAVSRLHDVPLERIGAAFWFGSVPPAGLTVRPQGLLDEAGLAALLAPVADT